VLTGVATVDFRKCHCLVHGPAPFRKLPDCTHKDVSIKHAPDTNVLLKALE
jgi:hypothetical protein